MRAPQRQRQQPTAAPRDEVTFISSGSRLLDLVLGGGWAGGRVINIIGGESAGKTLLAVEACANFLPYVQSIDDIRYAETEQAYSKAYGEEIGMPPDINPIDNIRTVEDLFDDITSFVEVRQKQDTPSLYVVDSLDALSDEAELKRDIRKGSFGAQKAANLSELFRRLNALMNNANTTLMIISQIRDNVGVMFGAKETRSGGKALGFYSSQIIWLKEIKRITRTVSGNSRSIGSQVRVRCSKNKVGKPRRECVINVMYNYGVDDETSMLDFLEEYKAAPALIKDVNSQLIEARRRQDREWLSEINTLLAAMVTDKWDEIEAAIAPTMRKYG